MKVFAGCFVDANDPENPPQVHVCSTEQALVDALLVDIGQYMTGITATCLQELDELVPDYCDNLYSCITYTVTELV